MDIMELVDSHAHISGDLCFEDAQGIVARAKAAGVGAIINVCIDETAMQRAEELSLETPLLIRNAFAIHPHDVIKHDSMFDAVSKYAAANKLVAIGETGLDYYYSFSPKEKQIETLRKHMQLAMNHELPVIIHCRDAFSDFFTILDEEEARAKKKLKGVLHCFTGTMEEMQKGLEKGFYISLSGIVTFPKSQVLQDIAKKIPLDKLLIETDAPFLAPQSKRGKRNESAYLVETVRFLAALLETSFEKLVQATAHNARMLFRLTEVS